MEFDDGDPEPEVEGIPLADEEAKKPAKPKSSPKVAAAAATPRRVGSAPKRRRVAQFLIDASSEGRRRDRPVSFARPASSTDEEVMLRLI